MTAFVALLRAINLPGHNQVAMADLRELLARLGFAEPISWLHSGNLVFRSKAASTAVLEQRLEAAAAKELGLETDFMVRSAEEWRRVVRRNPFPEAAERDPGRLLVVVFKQSVSRGGEALLRQAIKGREQVRAVGREAYLTYPDGIGRSRVSVALIERTLGSRGTGRNWNTVRKLATLLEGV